MVSYTCDTCDCQIELPDLTLRAIDPQGDERFYHFCDMGCLGEFVSTDDEIELSPERN